MENTWSYSSGKILRGAYLPKLLPVVVLLFKCGTSRILCRRCSSGKILRCARWSCCIFARQETPVQLSCQLLQKSNFPAYLLKIGQKFEFCYEFLQLVKILQDSKCHKRLLVILGTDKVLEIWPNGQSAGGRWVNLILVAPLITMAPISLSSSV